MYWTIGYFVIDFYIFCFHYVIYVRHNQTRLVHEHRHVLLIPSQLAITETVLSASQLSGISHEKWQSSEQLQIVESMREVK